MLIKIYFCYAHEDEALLTKLITHLELLQQQGFIEIWNDREIGPGTDWKREIDNHLNSAQIILLLISPNFMASDFCYSFEMQRAMERHNLKKACVIPIILSPCDWKSAPFGKLQALPKYAKPITDWDDREAAFNFIVDNIRIDVEEIILQRNTKQLLNDKALLIADTTKPIHQRDKELERIEDELEAAFEKKVTLAVQKELAIRTEQDAEKAAINESEQIRKTERIADAYAILAAILSGCILITIFEFSIRWFQWKWLLLHPNSYGIQVGFDVLLIFLSFCLFGILRVNQRKRQLSSEELTYLGILVAIMAILTAILVGTFQLLGGPPISPR